MASGGMLSRGAGDHSFDARADEVSAGEGRRGVVTKTAHRRIT